MLSVEALLRQQGELYPAMEPIDAIKLLYQRCFGAGHLIRDEEAALRYLREEHAAVYDGGALRLEELGDGMLRVYLNGVPPVGVGILGTLFLRGASELPAGEAAFGDALSRLEAVTATGALPFSTQDLAPVLAAYRAAGRPMVSHSDRYRAAYAPAYRVLPRRYGVLLPLLFALEARRERGLPTVLAIDGQCGSGKSTVAALLGTLYGASVVQADDFFLPPELRTEERMAIPMHYERFAREILPGLAAGQTFAYRAFDCGVMDYGAWVTVSAAQLVIVEGSYCLYPPLGRYYDCSVYLKTPMEERLRRLAARCGTEAQLQRFIDQWIPTEDAYCTRWGIDRNCDFVIET